MPTPIAAPSSSGEREGGHRLAEAERQHEQQRHRHRRAEIGHAVGGTARGEPMAEHDIADEQHAVEQRPEQARQDRSTI